MFPENYSKDDYYWDNLSIKGRLKELYKSVKKFKKEIKTAQKERIKTLTSLISDFEQSIEYYKKQQRSY